MPMEYLERAVSPRAGLVRAGWAVLDAERPGSSVNPAPGVADPISAEPHIQTLPLTPLSLPLMTLDAEMGISGGFQSPGSSSA